MFHYPTKGIDLRWTIIAPKGIPDFIFLGEIHLGEEL